MVWDIFETAPGEKDLIITGLDSNCWEYPPQD
jgi:hypothetical protein